ncbi:hypothetical protein RchiOBHm_Chr2g0175151 [Rosa chinensis]|uniref:Uncharacterized protein n=1 Tax=Rosa chinensis TaxID=74649 RepID=A0A2P6S6C4_ROSCH|nr:hypothetical protein RchiOBHm_Chr2g0175151 [Rosa chinensis]
MLHTLPLFLVWCTTFLLLSCCFCFSSFFFFFCSCFCFCCIQVSSSLLFHRYSHHLFLLPNLLVWTIHFPLSFSNHVLPSHFNCTAIFSSTSAWLVFLLHRRPFLHFNPGSRSADLRDPLGSCVCGTVDLLLSKFNLFHTTSISLIFGVCHLFCCSFSLCQIDRCITLSLSLFVSSNCTQIQLLFNLKEILLLLSALGNHLLLQLQSAAIPLVGSKQMFGKQILFLFDFGELLLLSHQQTLLRYFHNESYGAYLSTKFQSDSSITDLQLAGA